MSGPSRAVYPEFARDSQYGQVPIRLRWWTEMHDARRVPLTPASADPLLARPEGFEPPTPWSEATCSSPLSYGRVTKVG